MAAAAAEVAVIEAGQAATIHRQRRLAMLNVTVTLRMHHHQHHHRLILHLNPLLLHYLHVAQSLAVLHRRHPFLVPPPPLIPVLISLRH